MSQDPENDFPSESEFDELCRSSCDGYPTGYSGSIEEAGELLNRICWKLHYRRDPNTNNSYQPRGDSTTGPLYAETLNDYMKGAPYDHYAIARRYINQALGRTDPE
jgi:hypothetical protein